MKRYKLRFLGLLGLVGLLGPFTGNYGLLGFFGFFAFFAPTLKHEDELLQLNTRRAAMNAFVAASVAVVAGILAVSIYPSLEVATLFLVLIFLILILTFTFSLMYFERKGRDDEQG